EEVLVVEAERDLVAFVVGRDAFGSFAFFARLGGDLDFAFAEGEADRAISFVGHQAYAADGGADIVEIEDGAVLALFGHNHFVIRKLARELSRDQEAAFAFEEDVILVFAERNLVVAGSGELDELEKSLLRHERIDLVITYIDLFFDVGE